MQQSAEQQPETSSQVVTLCPGRSRAIEPNPSFSPQGCLPCLFSHQGSSCARVIRRHSRVTHARPGPQHKLRLLDPGKLRLSCNQVTRLKAEADRAVMVTSMHKVCHSAGLATRLRKAGWSTERDSRWWLCAGLH